jgi:O-acetyl-ADP-ribose deacetylase (regulator of RNase III)
MADWRIPICYVRGDATNPVGQGNKIIVHLCNDIGRWGAGFTEAVSYRWLKPSIAYHHFHMINDVDVPMELGTIQVVKVEDDIWVINLIGQHGVGGGNRAVAPIRYEAVRKGLRRVARVAATHNASVHMPRIGCGLAGGSWDQIEPLIQETLINAGIAVTVYESVDVDEGDY